MSECMVGGGARVGQLFFDLVRVHLVNPSQHSAPPSIDLPTLAFVRSEHASRYEIQRTFLCYAL